MDTNIPRHVAIIMDGNGRWAQKRGLPRIKGHEVGCERLEEVIDAAPSLGIEYLTVYAFSKENWSRPPMEVAFLMELLKDYLQKNIAKMSRTNVRFNAIGNFEPLSESVRERIEEGREKTKNNSGLRVTIAFNYSSRYEITEACQSIAREVKSGKLDLESINEQTISAHLYTSNIPDPDLLIRTSGEMRISNFLLWQISYSELYVTEKCWPEFTAEELSKAVEEFKKRERRFGRTAKVVS